MNWSQIQTLFDGQGMVFWAALAAVALGLTLLSVSIFFQVRKILSNSKFLGRKRNVQAPAVPAIETPAPRITVTEDGYQAAGFVPTPVAETPATAAIDPRLDILLARLKSSADRLDRIHGNLGHNKTATGMSTDSPLKGLSEEVDYVYKTGRA